MARLNPDKKGNTSPHLNEDVSPNLSSQQQLLVVSGLSGGGKSTALRALEDLGFYCVDNLPAALLPGFFEQVRKDPVLYAQVALGIDARSRGSDQEQLPEQLPAFQRTRGKS